jgi:hypothetical protein
MASNWTGSLEIFRGMALISQRFNKPTPDEP